jgi:hypothetical protein
MTLVLVFCIVFITGCSKSGSTKLTNTINELNFENIKSAKIELATAGALPIKTYTFDFNNPHHSKMIKDVINYLNSAKIQGNADEKITYKSSLPTFLILALKDVSVIKIKSAVRDKVTNLPDGSTERAKLDIPNEVTIIINSNEKPIRILSPEIRKLLDGGYKDVF